MTLKANTIRKHLRAFDFKKLFIEELGWDHHKARLDIPIDGQNFVLNAVAQKRGFQAFVCESDACSHIPDHAARRKIEKQVTKSAHEHLLIYVDASRTTQVWQWVKREPGKPAQSREHTYHRDQPGDALIQKLRNLFFPLEEEFALSLVDVTRHARAAFDVERVTKRFYDRFKSEHAAFLKFLGGIPDEDMQRWYVSVMLNRLMFIYFIQKKGFLNDDQNYLRTRLAESRDRAKDRFYRDFLCALFFEGFAKKEDERSPSVRKLLGEVPYLNGGLFLRHQIEEAHGKDIQIGDGAFEKLFSFFEQYQWHLDERPLRADNEINPDVLGYIFEKYINQKQMGAYYTKEDITGYISQNTVIPFLFDAAQKKCRIAFEGEQSIWRLLQSDPDRYIYAAVGRGVVGPDGSVTPESALPDFVQKGMCDPQARMFDKRYNLGEAVIPDADGNNLALPTETWREYVERRSRCLELRAKLTAGEIRSINDLITYNLDIRQFAQDVIENCEGPELLRAFYHAIEAVTVLDSACGSGAFLFATLNILEPLYEACLDRMESFLEDLERSGRDRGPEKFGDFRTNLDRVEQHPNRRYFVLKSIILNNLYGVDIMEEATEICKLRLFLKLVAQIDSVEKIEPLPDIDFNIRAGNSLVGYATHEEVNHAISSKLDFAGVMQKLEEKAQDVDRLFILFRKQQTQFGGGVGAEQKGELRRRLLILGDQLNVYLAGEYGVKVRDKIAFQKWRGSHKPFHWFIEFYGVMKSGGFSVSIGNPPYVELAQVRSAYRVAGYRTEPCGNLYALFLERSLALVQGKGRLGLVVQQPVVSTQRMREARQMLVERCETVFSSTYDDRPSKLFDGMHHARIAILLANKGPQKDGAHLLVTPYSKWYKEERSHLFERLRYVLAFRHAGLDCFPKIGSAVEHSVLKALMSCTHVLGLVLSERKTEFRIYYKITGVGHWFTITLRSPRFFRDGVGSSSTREESMAFNNKVDRDKAFAVLNSSLFYWFYQVRTNCRDFNPSDYRTFPMPAFLKADDFSTLSSDVQEALDATSEFVEIDHSKTGAVRFEQFRPREAKPVIDKIDAVLADRYGLNANELDFIVNYDIKYRMGREGVEEDGQE
jgi:hypothetical protein